MSTLSIHKERPWHVKLARWITGARRVDDLRERVELMHREMRVFIKQQADLQARAMPNMPEMNGAPADNAFPFSALCRQEHFEQPFHPYWMRRLHAPLIYHRKFWEHAFICQALWERGAIRPGGKGLGFGVGREGLVSLFADEGCDVLATDAPDIAETQGWVQGDQYTPSLESLWDRHICSEEAFREHVRFRACDMNAIPSDLTGFDFCWSSCAFEHLGSLEHDMRFVERAMDCLKPGGWAVHTTEFNVSSDHDTLEHGGTVLYRRRDMEELARRLEAMGHKVAPFDFNTGAAYLDGHVDWPPYSKEPHLKLAVAGYAATSIGIIVQRGA